MVCNLAMGLAHCVVWVWLLKTPIGQLEKVRLPGDKAKPQQFQITIICFWTTIDYRLYRWWLESFPSPFYQLSPTQAAENALQGPPFGTQKTHRLRDGQENSLLVVQDRDSLSWSILCHQTWIGKIRSSKDEEFPFIHLYDMFIQVYMVVSWNRGKTTSHHLFIDIYRWEKLQEINQPYSFYRRPIHGNPHIGIYIDKGFPHCHVRLTYCSLRRLWFCGPWLGDCLLISACWA